MDDDDPEKRIAELERQLSEAKPSQRPVAGRQAWAALAVPGTSRARRGRRWWVWGGVAASVVVAIVAAVVFVVIRVGDALAPAHLLNADGLNGVLTSMRSHFGDTNGYRMYVYDDHALLGRTTTKTYEYDGHEWSDWSGSVASSDYSADDLSRFDVAAVVATVASAPKSLGFTQSEHVDLIVSADVDALKLEVHVDDHGRSGWLELNPDGTVTKVHPPD